MLLLVYICSYSHVFFRARAFTVIRDSPFVLLDTFAFIFIIIAAVVGVIPRQQATRGIMEHYLVCELKRLVPARRRSVWNHKQLWILRFALLCFAHGNKLWAHNVFSFLVRLFSSLLSLVISYNSVERRCYFTLPCMKRGEKMRRLRRDRYSLRSHTKLIVMSTLLDAFVALLVIATKVWIL